VETEAPSRSEIGTSRKKKLNRAEVSRRRKRAKRRPPARNGRSPLVTAGKLKQGASRDEERRETPTCITNGSRLSLSSHESGRQLRETRLNGKRGKYRENGPQGANCSGEGMGVRSIQPHLGSKQLSCKERCPDLFEWGSTRPDICWEGGEVHFGLSGEAEKCPAVKKLRIRVRGKTVRGAKPYAFGGK